MVSASDFVQQCGLHGGGLRLGFMGGMRRAARASDPFAVLLASAAQVRPGGAARLAGAAAAFARGPRRPPPPCVKSRVPSLDRGAMIRKLSGIAIATDRICASRVSL